MKHEKKTLKNSKTITTLVRFILYAQIIISILSIISNYLERKILSDMLDGNFSSFENIISLTEASDERQAIVAYTYIGIYITSVVLISRWIFVANYNTRALGAANMKFTPGWAVGFYFIPILSLWKPFEAMKEIWKASFNPNDWEQQEHSQLLPLWWGLWITSHILGRISFRLTQKAEEIEEIMTVNTLSQISDILNICLAIVFLLIVNQIYSMQNKDISKEQVIM